mgnify:FL=1
MAKYSIYLKPNPESFYSDGPPFEDILCALKGRSYGQIHVANLEIRNPKNFINYANLCAKEVRSNKKLWRINKKTGVLRKATKRKNCIKIKSSTLQYTLNKLGEKYGVYSKNKQGVRHVDWLYFYHGKCGGAHGRNTSNFEVGCRFLQEVGKWNWVVIHEKKEIAKIPFQWK